MRIILDSLKINSSISINLFNGLKDSGESFYISAIDLTASWFDPRLSWNATQSPSKTVQLNTNDIWHPIFETHSLERLGLDF